MFVGTHQRSLDEKGRIALPAQYRDLLGVSCFAADAMDSPSIAVWSEEGFSVVAARLQERVQAGEVSQNVLRAFASSTSQLRVDGQGRVTLPEELRQRVGLDRDAVVIGAINRLEIWSPDRWESEHESVERVASQWI